MCNLSNHCISMFVSFESHLMPTFEVVLFLQEIQLCFIGLACSAVKWNGRLLMLAGLLSEMKRRSWYNRITLIQSHVKVPSHIILIFISYYFHIFLHLWARDPVLGSKAAVGRARAAPLLSLWGLGTGPGPKNVEEYGDNAKAIWEYCDWALSHCCHIYFSHLFSNYVSIFCRHWFIYVSDCPGWSKSCQSETPKWYASRHASLPVWNETQTSLL